MNLYVGHAICAMWNGLLCDFFVWLNGVKQGGVASMYVCIVEFNVPLDTV